jgi:hypothetical protein
LARDVTRALLIEDIELTHRCDRRPSGCAAQDYNQSLL